MKKIFIINALLISFLGISQNPITINVSGNIFNTKEDTVKISQFYGNRYVDFLKSPLAKNGDFTIKGSLPNADYYVLRLGNVHLNIILRNSSDMKIYGDGANIFAFSNIVGSDESSTMNDFIKVLSNWNVKQDSAITYLKSHPDKQQEVNSSMQKEYMTFQNSRQNFIAQNPNSAALMPILSAIDAEKEFELYESIVNQLVVGFNESPSIKELNNQLQQAKAKKAEGDIFATGKLAPDFTENKIDGKAMKLSDLKGKVVLLDFWASWCGPCRKENPNVVKLYQKYNKDGFTVMSVSLDQDKAKWQSAITADGLIWPNHVSDLKGWASAAGRIYQVTGIPFTVLIDQEGKIIKTNLRGEALEMELQQIFGH
jgi:thiol-disulfide isomerase/thioredoxin